MGGARVPPADSARFRRFPGVRVLIYAGEPPHDPIVAYIGDTQDDIVRLYNEYGTGRFPTMSDLAASLVPSSSHD